MKLAYKDRQDILWSLKENAKRLDEYEGDKTEEARASAARLRDLADRLLKDTR
jgi:hypothetical protein